MLKKGFPNVFPLLLTPIDSFYCMEDSAQYPMTSVIHLDFDGEMDRSAFQNALTDALYRHPLLSALIEPVKRNLPCWVPTEEIQPHVDWGSFDKPITCPDGEAINLNREVGIRFWIRTNRERTRMTVQVHHACTDGTGVYRFLGDLLAFYGLSTVEVGERRPRLGDVDARLLRKRRMGMTNLWGQGSSSQVLLNAAKEAWDVFGKRIRPLQQPNGVSPEPLCQFPGVQSVTICKDLHQQLRTFASQRGAMLNDLLMAEMFRTIVRWNDSEERSHPRDWLRVMMPSDLREVSHHEMPAANMTSYTFVTRRARACSDFVELLRSMRDETLRIKSDRRGALFVDAIMLNEFSPKVLPYLLRRQRCIATTTLSNVGDPSKRFSSTFPRTKGKVICGNLVLDQVSGVPPLRTNMYATLAVFSYCRQLTISVRCDPHQFHPADARRFLANYRDGLLSHLA